MTKFYTIKVEVIDHHAPSLREMTDIVADALERNGARECDYTVEVHGPPELTIGFRHR